jgi:alkylated DNA repair dioxygenase AlkB
MNLFRNIHSERANLLPHGGTVTYYGPIFSFREADKYFATLLENVVWKNDEVVLFGKHIVTRRKVAWYADKERDYAYSGTNKRAHAWSSELLALKKIVEEKVGETFNSCLLNLYHDGGEGLSWHSDNEKPLGEHAVIAALSFGAERKFVFKHKETKERVEILLEHGSLLVMRDATQENWLHTIPKTKKVTQPRISLTFRTIKEKGELS